MLNVNELESRWLKYKIKSYIPYITIAVSLTLITVLIYTIYNSKTSTQKVHTQKDEIQTKKEQSDRSKEIITTDNNLTQVLKEKEPLKIDKNSNTKKIILSPSLNFMSNMKHDAISSYENNSNPTSKVKKVIKQKTLHKPIQKAPQKQIEYKQQEIQKSSINIKRQNTQEDINHVIKRFNKNNNPALSLFVAKKYYELEEYNKSYNYALITNQINDNIDASWIVFAKSLVKLNKKDEAIKTLQKYINHSSSNQAKILLDEILSGKFK